MKTLTRSEQDKSGSKNVMKSDQKKNQSVMNKNINMI